MDRVITPRKYKKKHNEAKQKAKGLQRVTRNPKNSSNVENNQEEDQTYVSYGSDSITDDMESDESIEVRIKKRTSEKKGYRRTKKNNNKNVTEDEHKQKTKSIKTASNDEMSSNGVENIILKNGTDTKSESMPTKRLRKRRYEKLDDSYENDISLEDPFADSGDDEEYVPSSESHISDSLIDDMNSDESLKLTGNTHEIIDSRKLKKKAVGIKRKADEMKKLVEVTQNESNIDSETIQITSSQ
ncbi:hypothetical protein JTB14_006251 [Gonioctena quinquepunctata]|nr:hypothetical protein JTB14_006251 [Gonioctena quinquepunctata]